ncbi:MAG TPA: UDP-glucuronic acid decarboxylase family protein [Desulfomonilaceae bacterium]|nr:UDP-glucuronic acid decarboxylase family protein [Desulfomonilaceae bacterium]
MKNVVVTGGAGFIGSHLIGTLLSRGEYVICLDNLFTGSKRNIAPFLNNPNFEFVRHDVVVPILLEADEVYHLACPASPVHYQNNPIKTLKTSVLGTLNMLGLTKRTRAKILLASTSEVYGDPNVHPQPESYYGNVNPVGPRACYDEGKRAAETLMVGYRDYNHVNVAIARIFNTYGPRMLPNDGRVVSNFICQALRGHNITLYGDGKQTRSFCYISDMVDGLVRLMESSETTPVNLGNPHEVTIQDLAEKILEMIPATNSGIEFRPLPTDDPIRRKPDISRARNILKWEPKVPLESGLEATIAYFREALESVHEPE